MARKPLTPDQLKKLEHSLFRRKITTTFKNLDFEYLKTDGIHRRFGLKKGELDYVFLHKNIILVCEDTTTNDPKKIKRHLKNKKLLTDQIDKNKEDTIDWLKKTFPEKFAKWDDFSHETYRIFHLYFPKNKSDLSEEDMKLYDPIRVVELPALNYFFSVGQTIKKSGRYEVFRFLSLKAEDVGTPPDGDAGKNIPTPIIYPTDNTGLKNGIRIVSFMMSADMLLRNSYVMRKDSWEGSIKLYQRLLQRTKLQNTRKFVAQNESTFFNNIIVSMPKGVTFTKGADGSTIQLKEIHKYQNCKMNIPDEINSICVIDGQHRIFAHYEGLDDLEKKISELRSKLHLLVTGLIFPDRMSDLERRKYESAIFEDINSNAKPVPPDVLLQIRSLQEPFSDLAIARRVISELNESGVFQDQFQMSQMDGPKIRVASIIKYALRYLVDITDDKSHPSLFQHWSGDKNLLLKKEDEDALNSYVKYVASVLNAYFYALKGEYSTEWADRDSKVRSITSLNGFLIALRRSLSSYPPGDNKFYSSVFGKKHFDFSKENFGYASSQWNMFAEEKILPDNFLMKKDADGNWHK